MSQYQIEIVADGGYFWRLVASNGETLAHSEQYSTKWSASRTAKKLGKITGFPVIDTTK